MPQDAAGWPRDHGRSYKTCAELRGLSPSWMANRVVQYSPITPVRGGLTHATSLATPGETACGRRYSGWKVALEPLTCMDCKAAVFLKVRRKRKVEL